MFSPQHVHAILAENKDMYMLNPCSANIWFVIELCEPVQVIHLHIFVGFTNQTIILWSFNFKKVL